MTSDNLAFLANHLWQSSIFAAGVWLLSMALKKQRAGIRYAIWLAASLKFLLPFALLVSIGSRLEWRSSSSLALSAPSSIPAVLDRIGQPFANAGTAPVPVAPAPTPLLASRIPAVVSTIWLAGFLVAGISYLVRWWRVRAVVRAALPLRLDLPIEARASSARLEPGVFGILKPVLLLPDGILDRLSPAQLQAVLAHELCHVRRRDNLAAAVHMLVEALFWFYPLVWWIGSRLIEERERACDEAVLEQLAEPEIYAEGILSVCKFYVASPLRCVSGVTGSNLKRRIEEIMTAPKVYGLTLRKKALVVMAGISAIAMPVAIGVFNAPPAGLAYGQTASTPSTFEVASVKPNNADDRRIGIQILPGGGLRTTGTSLKFLISFAYDVRNFQITGGPGWINSDRFDIMAKSERDGASEASPDDMRKMSDAQMKTALEQLRQKLQALLAERFQLTIHHETKEVPVYALVVGKNGPKLTESQSKGGDNRRMMRMAHGELNGEGVELDMLVRNLSDQLDRPVIDRTGLKGKYDFKLTWTPEPGQGPGGFGPPPGGADGPTAPDPNGPSVFTAVQEQLGLRLESTKGPVDLIVIDKVNKLSEN